MKHTYLHDVLPFLRELEREKQAKQVIAANELATRFFQACLTKTDYGIKAQEYLTGRGITPEIIERFSIGVALPNYNALLSALGKRGCSAGLVSQRRPCFPLRGGGEGLLCGGGPAGEYPVPL